ncbi:FtsQ-type POTRA domain-containing protein, partial [Arthrobacter deserti]|nr:FtsQ-type POTRA domain-containing protein [Arthrobacter deserti]
MTGRRPRRPPAPRSGQPPAAGRAKASTPKVQAPGQDAAAQGPPPAGSAGAASTVLHFPEPAGRKIRRRVWTGVALVLVLVAATIGVLVFSPVLAVKTITVQGTDLVPAQQVDSLLAPLAGTPLPQITDADVRSLLAEVPAVAGVKVEARPPSELAVRITERVPVAVLKAGKRYALDDEEGRRLASVKSRDSVKLPLINAAKARKDPEVFRTITAVLGALPP